MAGINTQANITISINGKQAQQMMTDLQKRSQNLEKQIDAAAKAGDKAKMTKLNRELKQVRTMMDQLNGSANSVEKTLHGLDKATPKELNKALKQLQRDLNKIERGSDAWNRQIEQIRRVKEEINHVNASMRTQESGIGRLQGFFDKWNTSIMAVGAALFGIVDAGRAAVKSFAEMEQEMANVRKYTGMSAEEVERLNEEFKKMDTRSSRQDLNKMAQEAGRLGKTSLEDVLGYVRAADKINVALDDLGEGATLTLSKLAGIFGDEERLGTEKALLSIGSVINELSQNCSASAPYLASFASRLGGVGKQAGLTIQQIMGFGAVLDSSNQKVEASATAISQVMVRIYQDPAKYARVAGLEVASFAELVKKDMNEAFLLFLETLSKAGSMDVLSPMFKDMGENGARAISALSTLASKIDDVKEQQKNANVAFDEATSIGTEFDVQNNTVMAGMEKARKSITEVSVALGEKLQPIMRHVFSSTSMILKGVSAAVDIFIEYRRVILTAVVAVTAYNLAMATAAIRTGAATMATKAWGVAVGIVNGIAPVFRLGVAAMVNSVQFLTNGFRVNIAMQQRWQASMNAMKFAHWTGLVIALASAVYLLWKRNSEYVEKLEEVSKGATDVEDATMQEIKKLDELFGTLEAARKGTEDYEKAKDSILSQYGRYLGGLVTEEGQILDLEKAYDRLTAAVRRSAMERNMAKASENLDEQFDKSIMELTNKLKDSLVEFGASTRDAVRISTKVMSASVRGNDIPKDLEEEIRGYSKGFTNSWGAAWSSIKGQTPYMFLRDIRDVNSTYANSRQYLQDAKEQLSPYASMSDSELEFMVGQLEKSVNYVTDTMDVLVKFGKEGVVGMDVSKQQTMSKQDAGRLLEDLREEQAVRGINGYRKKTQGAGEMEEEESGGSFSPGTKVKAAKGGGSDRFKAEKEWRDNEKSKSEIDYYTGETNYVEYQKRLEEIEIEFNRRKLERTDITEKERISSEAALQKALFEQDKNNRSRSVDEEKRLHEERLAELAQFYLDESISQRSYQIKTEEENIEHQRNLVAIYAEGSAERLAAEKALTSLLTAQQEKRRKETETRIRKEMDARQALKDKYFGMSASEADVAMDRELENLRTVYDWEIRMAGLSKSERLRIEEQYEKARRDIRKKYRLKGDEPEVSAFRKGIESSVKWLKSDAGKAVTDSFSTLASGMNAIFDQATDMIKADLEVQTAAIDRRYDAEISRAEGNAFKVKSIEKKKEDEIARLKQDANRKMFAMQVIQAIAQTAQNALNAYGSAAAIPVVGHVMAPIAAAMAVAAGMLQVANIKKQQQASEAQGYAEGGFTRKGRKYEPAGIVHAGEWVASQAIVNNPATRPLIEALDYAQRTNTVGRMSAADVSRSITAPAVYAAARNADDSRIAELSAVVERLADRLDEPFVTVATVAGDEGINRKQEEYARLMRNKSPKSR